MGAFARPDGLCPPIGRTKSGTRPYQCGRYSAHIARLYDVGILTAAAWPDSGRRPPPPVRPGVRAAGQKNCRPKAAVCPHRRRLEAASAAGARRARLHALLHLLAHRLHPGDPRLHGVADHRLLRRRERGVERAATGRAPACAASGCSPARRRRRSPRPQSPGSALASSAFSASCTFSMFARPVSRAALRLRDHVVPHHLLRRVEAQLPLERRQDVLDVEAAAPDRDPAHARGRRPAAPARPASPAPRTPPP